MASLTNNNSSSSPLIPNRPNPKPRNSEAADPMRRSFGGNPFPAKPRVNISSDISRRNSFGSKLDFSDKENETKPFPTPKGFKNFMSPTISAVSKINSSPRKKVLSDRNGMSRSLTLEDTKSNNQANSCVSFSDVVHIIDIDEKKQFDESHDMTITDFVEKEEIVHSDPRFRISPRPSVPYASPEFSAPYDPKKNYLSPRPQFLHYKPNPRIEQRFDECKQLDELFISESSSSDNELSAEETEKCEEQEKEGGAETVVEEEETEDVEQLDAESDEQMVCESIEEIVEQLKEGRAEAVVEEGTEDVEQLEAESDEEMVSESIEETTQVPKQFGFRKFKFFGCFLALAMAYLLVSATFPPPTELAILQESPSYEFYIPKVITEFAKANNLEHLSEKLWSYTESSIVYIDKLISRLGGEEEYDSLQFCNLTDILEGYTVFQPKSVGISEVAPFDHLEEPEEPLQEQSQGENSLEDGYINEYEEPEEPLQEKSRGENNLEDENFNEYEEESRGEENSEVVCETKDGDEDTINKFDEQSEMKLGKDVELSESRGNWEAIFEDGVELNTEEMRVSEVNLEEKTDAGGSQSQEKLETGSTKNDQELEEAAGSTKKDQEELEKTEIEVICINQHEVESAAINGEQHFQTAESGSEEGFVEIAAEISDNLDLKVRSSSKTGNGLANATMIVLSSSVLVLLASVAFLFGKKAKTVAASIPENTEELKSGHVTDKLSSLNLQEEVDDRTSESFHKNRSFLSNKKDPKEHQSSRSKLRRESMASSASEYSVGSFSYGSFTTFEKIPIKAGDKEEEMITPVRRSSRLRNHHQSSSGL